MSSFVVGKPYPRMAFSYPVSSAIPSSPPKRPAFLGVALTVAWFLGLTTVQEGYVALRLVRDPLSVDSLGLPNGMAEALVEGVMQHGSTALPIALAQFLLGGLLVVVSAGLLFGARIPRQFAVQVVSVNLAFAAFAYYMNEPMRRGIINALVSIQPGELTGRLERDTYVWGFRVGLGLHLMSLGLSAWALTRPSVREFLAYGTGAPPPRES
jgi:hypothetical protein